MRIHLGTLALLLLLGCGSSVGVDAGRMDAAPTDAGSFDAGSTDSGSMDAGSSDAGSSDGGSSDAGSVDASTETGFACDPSLGSVRPLEPCTAENPCVDLLVTVSGDSVTEPTNPAVCRTTESDRGSYDDGAARTITIDGVARERCEYRVPGATAGSQRALVVFFHGAGGAAANAYDGTLLRDKAASFDLSDDPSRPGFHLVSVQGRNLHWPTEDPRDGSHHDIFHRDLGSPSTNPDIAHADALIDEFVASGTVDPNRVYVMGWSNGGFFAQLYAIARHDVATPGGTRVAAAAVFTAADPFHEARAGESPSCRLSTYPTSDVPIFIVGRACDLVACDEAQDADLGTAAPGAVVSTWMDDLVSRVGNPNGERRIIAGNGRTVRACTAPAFCGVITATLNHTRWPDGVADRSGVDHEADMLSFLRRSPL